MITKNQTKTQYFLDRDTDVEELVDKMLRVKRAEAIVFLRRQQDRLNEKDAGTFFTFEDTLKLKEGELENMQRFFRGAVAPYYVRQKYNIWSPSIDGDMLKQGTDEIKRAVGFMKYDHTGHITKDVNSMTTFERAKDINEWLKAVEEVCFDDEGFIFPDSKHFLNLVKLKGRHSAHRQVIQELHEKVKNRYQGREII